MTMNLKNLTLAVLTVSGITTASLAAMTTSASAHVVCDYDGDDCRRTHPDYDNRGWNRDWHERREWQERRERYDDRQWYWNHRRYPYGWDRPYSGGNLWFNF
jgi:hypothetical protein